LELVKDQLFCRNSLCEAQSSKKLEHFSKVLKIKGLGPKTIEKLGISTVIDLYNLSIQEMINVIGDKLGTKLANQLELSKESSLDKLLNAFSINLIGSTAARKITDKVHHIDDITHKTCTDAGLGPKACDSLLSWIDKEFVGNLDVLPFTFKSPEKKDTVVKVLDLTAVITGKLDDFKNRNEAGEYLRSLGFKVTTSISKNTDYLVDETGKSSSKRTKAESLNIPIVTIKQLVNLI
jgi:DNA ligase (NAD+)